MLFVLIIMSLQKPLRQSTLTEPAAMTKPTNIRQVRLTDLRQHVGTLQKKVFPLKKNKLLYIYISIIFPILPLPSPPPSPCSSFNHSLPHSYVLLPFFPFHSSPPPFLLPFLLPLFTLPSLPPFPNLSLPQSILLYHQPFSLLLPYILSSFPTPPFPLCLSLPALLQIFLTPSSNH